MNFCATILAKILMMDFLKSKCSLNKLKKLKGTSNKQLKIKRNIGQLIKLESNGHLKEILV